MNIIVNRKALLACLNAVAPIVPAKSPKPILQCVGIRAEAGKITVTGSNIEQTIMSSTIQLEIKDSGHIVVPFERIHGLVGEVEDETLTMTADLNAVTIRGSRSRFTVNTFPVTDWISEPDAGDVLPMVTCTAKDLIWLFTHLIPTTGKEFSKYCINGIHLERNATHLIGVGTDGRRLGVAQIKCTIDDDPSCIIPIKAITAAVKLFTDPEKTIELRMLGNQLGMSSDDSMIVTNLIDGIFPPWEDIIPKGVQPKIVRVSTPLLVSALRQADTLTTIESKGVRFTFDGKKSLSIFCLAPEIGESEINLFLVEETGNELQIGFNPKLLSEILKSVDAAEITLELQAHNKPMLIRDGADFKAVLMPVSLQ